MVFEHKRAQRGSVEGVGVGAGAQFTRMVRGQRGQCGQRAAAHTG